MKPLTADDISPLWEAVKFLNPWPPCGHFPEHALAFANAVLAKFGGGISEAETRERERAAWDAGASFDCHHGTLHVCDDVRSERDRRYPSLTPAPRTVTLAKEGREVRRRDGRLEYRFLDPKYVDEIGRWHTLEMGFAPGHSWTPEGLEAVAALLRE